MDVNLKAKAVKTNKEYLESGVSFDKSCRLLCSSDFSKVFAKPVKVGDQCFTILAINNTLSSSRLGLAVAKKHAKHAVQRNRLKRIIRESFRLHRLEFCHMDVVVLIKPKSVDTTNVCLFKQLNKLWMTLDKRIRKLKEEY